MRRDQVLRIVDNFAAAPPSMGPFGPTPAPPTHGQQVSEAARQAGYEGPIATQEVPRDPMSGEVIQASRSALNGPGLSAEDTLGAFNRFAVGMQSDTLNGAARALNQDARDGVSNSVTNFSLGAGPALIADSIYRDARQGWGPPPPESGMGSHPFATEGYQRSQNLMNNLANAWGIDPKALTSEDPAVSGPARQQFQQRLINQAQATDSDPSVQQAQQNYKRAEQAYTGNANSVVVSAGNWGALQETMRADNGGRDIQVPDGFAHNRLAGPNSINVGSIDIDPQGRSRIADYSQEGQGVHLYAYGNIPFGNGTSFAAPRAAAVAQALRLENPGASAQDIRERTIQVFTTRGSGATAEGPNMEQVGVVSGYLGQVQWPRQTFVTQGPG